jgi:hypothetical protein
VTIKRILARLFWRIILPFLLALLIAAITVMEASGRFRVGFSGGGGIGFLLCTVALFCLPVGIAFWNTLRWGKEAEEFESHLKDAGEIERERQRRKKWIER